LRLIVGIGPAPRVANNNLIKSFRINQTSSHEYF